MDEIMNKVESDFIRDDMPDLTPGDKVRVHEQVKEGSKQRVQIFEGVLLKKSGSGANAMITVRKHSSGIGVEKTLPIHSPKIEKIELVKKGNSRQARPYYLRRESKY
mgnify:FL=1